MADNNDSKMDSTVGLDTTAFKTGVAELTAQIKSIETSFRASAAMMLEWSSSTSGLTERTSSLTEKLDLQKQKLQTLHDEYTKTVAEQGATSKAAESLANQMYSVEKAISATQSDINKYNSQLEAMKADEDKASSALGQLNTKISEQESALTKLKEQYANAALEEGKFSSTAKEIAAQIKTVSTELNENKSKLESVSVGFKDAGEKALSFGDVLKANVLGNVITNGLQSLGNAIKGLGTNALESADTITQMATATGMSTDAIQEWQYVGKDLGVSLDTITGAQAKLTKSMSAAEGGTSTQAKAFKELGLSIYDSTGHLNDAKTTMMAAFDALGRVGNETERDAISMTLFGKSAQDLNPLIVAGTAKVKELSDQAQSTGAVMSGPTVAALKLFNDKMAEMQESIQGAVGSALAQLLPSLESLMDKVKNINFTPMIDAFKWLGEHVVPIAIGLAAIGTALEAFKIADTINKGVTAFKAFTTAISAAKDAQLALKAFSVAIKGATVAQDALNVAEDANPIGLIVLAIAGLIILIAALIANWSKITAAFQEATDGWKEIGDSIGEWFNGTFIKFFVDTGEKIFSTFMSVIQKIEDAWNAVIGFFVGIGDDIAKGFNTIGDKISNAFMSAFDFITNLPAEALQWGKDMIDNFTAGIRAGIKDVEDAVESVGNTIHSYLHFSVPDVGPLADFQSWMPDFMTGLADGMTSNINQVKAAASGIASTISLASTPVATASNSGSTAATSALTSAVNALSTKSASTSGAQSSSATSGTSTPIVINITSALDGKALAKGIYKYTLAQNELQGVRLINEVT